MATSGSSSTGPSNPTDPTNSTTTGTEETQSSGLPMLGTESETSKTEFDCLNVPEEAESWQLIEGARGYHGLAIVPDGRIIGSDGSSLVTSTYDGATGLLVPGIGSGQQMDILLDGDIAYAASGGALTRVRLDGTIDTIRENVGAYGVRVGHDGMVYAVRDWEDNGLVRIDPTTGDEEALFFASPAGHSMGFSPDWGRMYMGTVGDNRRVYYADVDATLTPTMEMAVLTDEVGEGNSNWHDAVAVDACGNLYIPDYWSKNIYRVTPLGESSIYWTPSESSYYGHGLIWGTGQYGWRADALYMPNPYNNNTVAELVIGVPGRSFEGTVLNAPPMKGRVE